MIAPLSFRTSISSIVFDSLSYYGLNINQLIFTGIFAVLGIILIVLMIIMFKPKKEAESAQTAADAAKYTAGVYTSGITIGDSAIDVEVVVDTSHINSIRLVNLSESVTTMYPLVQPALEDLASQIYESQTTDGITFSADSKYFNTYTKETSVVNGFFGSQRLAIMVGRYGRNSKKLATHIVSTLGK